MTERACAPADSAPISWRLRLDPPLSGEENMRRDEAALEAQRAAGAEPVLRFFRWREPTLTFGRLQDPAAARARAAGAPAVRRPTGGGAVRHDRDLSFSLAWRRDHAAFPRCLGDVYRAVHETVRAALARRGIATTLAPRRPPAVSAVCFSEPVEHDLLWNGRKVLGGAIRVTAWGRLYQGSLACDVWGWTVEETAGLLREEFEKGFFRRPPAAVS